MKRKRNRSESNYVRRKINRWTRFLAKERDWDYTFMLEIEYMKLRQMEEYFKGRDTFIGIECVRRDLRICLRLQPSNIEIASLVKSTISYGVEPGS